MARHSHRIVETESGPIGFGLDRETDERTLVVYLQKLSDDELASLFDLVCRLLRDHLSEPEYHRLFLKEDE